MLLERCVRLTNKGYMRVSEFDRLKNQWDEMFVASTLRDIGFNSQEIKLVKEILEKENIPLKALLRQALRKWQGAKPVWNKKDLYIFE